MKTIIFIKFPSTYNKWQHPLSYINMDIGVNNNNNNDNNKYLLNSVCTINYNNVLICFLFFILYKIKILYRK